MVEEVNSERLSKIVRTDKSTVLVLFYGNWCIDCRNFKPIWEKWVRTASGLLFSVHVERGGPEWKEWDINEVPTVAAYSDGIERGRADGVIKEAELARLWKLV